MVAMLRAADRGVSRLQGIKSHRGPPFKVYRPRSRAKRNCCVGIFLSTPSQRHAHGTSVDIENSVALRATPPKAQVGAPISTGLLGLDGLLGLRGWQVVYVAEAIPTVAIEIA